MISVICSKVALAFKYDGGDSGDILVTVCFLIIRKAVHLVEFQHRRSSGISESNAKIRGMQVLNKGDCSVFSP